LLSFAKKEKAELVAVCTHGRKGFARLTIGSFAETLIAHANLPVLSVNKGTAVPTQIKTIAFPTHFSLSSKKAFQHAIKIAAQFNGKLVLINAHRIPDELAYGEMGYGLTPDVLEKVWFQFEQEQREKGARWVELAESNGVEADFIFTREPGLSSEVIVKTASKAGCDIMIVSSELGEFSQLILGYTLRTILATSRQPVVTLHV
jgi:nucleotide-binding universal stress UspA family protein